MTAIAPGPQVIDGQNISVINLASFTTSGTTGATGTATAGAPIGDLRELHLGFNITASTGSSPTLTLSVDTLGVDGIWYSIYKSSAISSNVATTTSIGVGCATNAALGAQVRLSWTVGGTATPTVTFSASLMGR